MRLRPLLLVTGVLGAAGILGYSQVAKSADHLDSPATIAAPTADLNDLYTWTSGTNTVLAMTLYPNAPTGTAFDPTVQYVFHTKSGPSLGATAVPVDIIATFDASQNVSLWVVDVTSTTVKDYVTGNATDPANPLVAADGKVTVFTGMRADPFFFNLDGFKAAVADVEAAAGGLTLNMFGCPTNVTPAISQALVTQLGSSGDGGPPQNFFATFNALAIAVSVDTTLLTSNGTTMSVWAGTYK